MFLKALTLKGFKSFADPTTLVFEPGMTVIVGPNGSGKSNVVDAVVWVLGAQAPTSVRSTKMDDVIFVGTASRPGLGRAEVSLVIDNADRLMPIDFEEVTVTRTLFRSGDSSYAINGVPCRLLDVQELLSDAGVGRQQHVIISQRQIDGVLSARPEDRRAVIEEAAGVLKFRRRKEKSERRLAATETNLTRLSDVVREIRRQLRPLERQAQAARRYGDLVVEMNGLSRYLTGREIHQLRSQSRQLTEEQTTARREKQTLTQQIEDLDREVAEAEAQMSAVDGHDLSDALARYERLDERISGLEAVLAERRLRLQGDRDAGVDEDVVATLEAESARLGQELEKVEAEVEALAHDQVDLTSAEEELEQLRLAFHDQWGDAPDEAALSEAPQIRAELKALESATTRDQEEFARLVERVTALRSRLEGLAAVRDLRVGEVQEAQAALKVGQDEQVDREQVAAQAQAECDKAKDELAATERDRDSWVARREALAVALSEVRDRAGAEQLSGIQGVVGTLLEVVDVDRGWEAAFEAAASEALASVVTADTEAAMRAISTLEETKVSGAVLVLDRSWVAPPPPQAGEPLRAHVRSSQAGVDRLLDVLVGGVGVVADTSEAVAAAMADPHSVVVTRSGDRFSPSGWRVGVCHSVVTGGALEEAEQEASRTEAAVVQAEQALSAADNRRADADGAVEACRATVQASSERLAARRADAETASRELRDVEVELAALVSRQDELKERIDQECRQSDELRQKLPEHEAKESQYKELAQGQRQARDELEGRVGQLRSEFQVREAGLQERYRLLKANRDDVDQRLQRTTKSWEQATARREAIEQRLAVVDEMAVLVAHRGGEVKDQLGVMRSRRAQESELVQATSRELKDLRERRTVAEARLGEFRERDSRAEVDLAEVSIRLEAAMERCRRMLDCEPGEAVDAECPPLEEGVTPSERIDFLQQELSVMGPINPLALQEYESLSERHEFIQGQIDDIRQSRRDLRKIIRKIDEEIVSVFSAAYADVSQNFSEIFTNLFPGGEGSLKLTQPDALLDTGVEIEARPSGKNIRKLSLLSGGERSLTALAYLFAVFRSRPSPFYVMDEVEAALDDLNLHRFLQLVEEFKVDSQLLLVSHQKRTMEAADCLYGVSMKSGGSSKVLSERAEVLLEKEAVALEQEELLEQS